MLAKRYIHYSEKEIDKHQLEGLIKESSTNGYLVFLLDNESMIYKGNLYVRL